VKTGVRRSTLEPSVAARPVAAHASIPQTSRIQSRTRIFRSTRDIEPHASPRIDPRGAQDFPQ